MTLWPWDGKNRFLVLEKSWEKLYISKRTEGRKTQGEEEDYKGGSVEIGKGGGEGVNEDEVK